MGDIEVRKKMLEVTSVYRTINRSLNYRERLEDADNYLIRRWTYRDAFVFTLQTLTWLDHQMSSRHTGRRSTPVLSAAHVWLDRADDPVALHRPRRYWYSTTNSVRARTGYVELIRMTTCQRLLTEVKYSPMKQKCAGQDKTLTPALIFSLSWIV